MFTEPQSIFFEAKSRGLVTEKMISARGTNLDLCTLTNEIVRKKKIEQNHGSKTKTAGCEFYSRNKPKVKIAMVILKKKNERKEGRRGDILTRIRSTIGFSQPL